MRPSDYLKINKRICMKFLPELCLQPRNNLLDFGNDPVYDPDLNQDPIRIMQICMRLSPEVSLKPRTNPINCLNYPDYDPDSRPDPGFGIISLI